MDLWTASLTWLEVAKMLALFALEVIVCMHVALFALAVIHCMP